MNNLAIGIGGCEEGSPYGQGLRAAREAIAEAENLPPALALVAGRNLGSAAEILRGVREVLGGCPLLGCVSDTSRFAAGPTPVQGVRVLLFASPYVKAKVGVGGATGWTWEQEVAEAFRESYIHVPVPEVPETSPEKSLYQWYLYRRPSLALALVISRPGERRLREQRVAAFLRKRLHGRIPFLVFSHAPQGEEPAVLADERLVTSGIVFAMIKTDLQFSLERFHQFEPLGMKLFTTRIEGNRIREFNGRPALEAYLEALGLARGAAPGEVDGPGLFSLFPLAHRGRDGRYHLLLPEGVGDDGSIILPVKPDPDHPLYPMTAISSAEEVRSRSRNGHMLATEPQEMAGAILFRNPELRDLPTTPGDLPGRNAGEGRVVEIACGRELEAFVSHRDWEGETGHLLLLLQNNLDPMAVAAVENERLLSEVMRLKDLNQKIFDGIGDGIALVSEGRRIQHCNDTYRTLMGLPADDLQGATCPLADLSPPVCTTCAAAQALERQSFVTQEVVRTGGAGTTWLRMDAFPLRDESGNATAAIEVIRDITIFKRLSQSLESEQRKMEAVVRGMAETLYIVGPHYDLQFFHRGAFPLPAEDEADLRDRKCFELIFHRDFPCPWCRMPETLTTGLVDRRIAQLTGRGGEENSCQITFSPWRDGQGDTLSVACLLVDISSQRRMEQQLIRSEKLNSLAILSAGMAHELNNPLGAINFNLEILKNREKNQEYQEVLGSIKKDVMRINRIVGNLLSFSKSGVSSYTWLRLPEMIDAALDLFQVVMDRNKVQVKKTYQADLPLIWGNTQDLQQVFINFISNSIDAMPAGGAIEIGVTAALPDDGEHGAARIGVVYDHGGDITVLRTLIDVPGWEAGFFRGDDEAIDYLRQRHASPPDLVILDYAAVDYDRLSFFLQMVKEVAPKARVLLIEGSAAAEDRLREKAPGVDRFLRRPFGAEPLLGAVRSLLPTTNAPSSAQPVVAVSFSDSGIGIPPAIQERIFDPFFTTKSENKGTGLGLSVVHKILENHAATIRVRSSPGEGTTFRLQFPQTRPLEKGPASQFHGVGGIKGVWP